MYEGLSLPKTMKEEGMLEHVMPFFYLKHDDRISVDVSPDLPGFGPDRPFLLTFPSIQWSAPLLSFMPA